jgi:hypothetical protein
VTGVPARRWRSAAMPAWIGAIDAANRARR